MCGTEGPFLAHTHSIPRMPHIIFAEGAHLALAFLLLLSSWLSLSGHPGVRITELVLCTVSFVGQTFRDCLFFIPSILPSVVMPNPDYSCQLLLWYFLLFVVFFFVALRAIAMDQDSTVLGIKQKWNNVTELRCPHPYPPKPKHWVIFL